MSPTLSHTADFIGKTIDNGRLQFVEVLGEGAYGIVYRAVDCTSATSSSSPEPKSYAVKIVEKAEPHSRRSRYQQREAIAHLHVSDHPNIVSMHGLYECPDFIYMVLEYCPGGDLLDAVVERLLYCRNDALLKSVFVQILDAVEYCHERGIYHRDLKPDNILVSKDGSEIKVADFGLATTAKVSDVFGCGSSHYMSPECIGDDRDLHPYSTEANDVWSLGVILTNLVTGRNPWSYATTDDKCYSQYLANPDYLREVLPISTATSKILQAIFTSDAAARISISELRERILAVDTFVMSEEDIARANKHVKSVAATYRPPMSTEDVVRNQSVFSDEDARYILEDMRTSSEPMFKFVIAPTEGISLFSDDSSSEESQGPITPQTHAQDPVKLAEVPELLESEIGEAISVTRKTRSLPLQAVDGPVAIAVPA